MKTPQNPDEIGWKLVELDQRSWKLTEEKKQQMEHKVNPKNKNCKKQKWK